jgi:hypothetical protein|tara:strand:- start:89 stop:757 length:669 start_codon:yes stop_codon:yes gene_type:complete
MEFIARKADWTKYADIVGDKNPIHRDGDYVLNSGLLERLGIKDTIAPGMYIGSHAHGDSPVQRVEFWFKNPVCDGDVIHREGDSFYRGDDLVCKGDVILGGSTGKEIASPENIVYSQDFYASKENVRDFLGSIGSDSSRANPEMYLMALSAPALLGYAGTKKLVGMHAYQSMEVHKPFSLDNIRVNVEERKVGKRMWRMNLFWESDGDVVATGEAKVLPLAA